MTWRSEWKLARHYKGVTGDGGITSNRHLVVKKLQQHRTYSLKAIQRWNEEALQRITD